jgi:hypothetical protein
VLPVEPVELVGVELAGALEDPESFPLGNNGVRDEPELEPELDGELDSDPVEELGAASSANVNGWQPIARLNAAPNTKVFV